MCPVCNALLNSDSEVCPVCALKSALESENHATATELRFEHYQILKNEGQGLMELGRGAMGITYKALDVDLRCPVTLKVISERYLGDKSAQLRFLREARAAASVRHPNVASVFHLGRTGSSCFYAMETRAIRCRFQVSISVSPLDETPCLLAPICLRPSSTSLTTRAPLIAGATIKQAFQEVSSVPFSIIVDDELADHEEGVDLSAEDFVDLSIQVRPNPKV